MTRQSKDIVLGNDSDEGFVAGRRAVEANNEDMLDLLLEHMAPIHWVKRSRVDDLSTIQRAVQVNPAWLTKFNLHSLNDVKAVSSEAKSDLSLETVLLMMLDLDDMDNREKYKELWNEYEKQDAKAASIFIRKCLQRKHVALASTMLHKYASSIDVEPYVDLLDASIEYDNPGFFKSAQETLPKGASIISYILNSEKDWPLDIFLKSEHEITRDEFRHILYRDSIPETILSKILQKGVHLYDGAYIRRQLPEEKFALFLQSGFFPAVETLFQLQCRGAPMLCTEPCAYKFVGVSTLADLAVMLIRNRLILSQNKSLQFICAKLKYQDKTLPKQVQEQLLKPFRAEHMEFIRDIHDRFVESLYSHRT